MEKQIPKNFNPEPFPYHHEMELEIVSLTNLGMGIGKVDDWVVMIPYTIPGESVRVRIFRNHKNYSEADLLEVVKPSSDRTQPKCQYFGNCGGCQYQHIEYNAQLEWKRQHVEESLLKIGGIQAEVQTPIHSEPYYNYRSKITPHHQKPKNKEIQAIGFLAATSRSRIIDIEQCDIATAEINAQYTIERQNRRELAKKGKIKKGATLLMRHSMEGVTTDHSKVVTERVGQRIFQFKAGDFFQNNPYLLPKIVEYVVHKASEDGLPYLIDAYCGSGLFSISAASHFEKSLGIEISESSVQWARGNAHLNQLNNCNFIVGDAKSIFEEVEFPASESVLIIDPPRKGCDHAFLQQVSNFLPRKIIYVSCAPATQARDLIDLLKFGYEIQEVQPVDLFPQTRHIENIVTLNLK